MQHLHDDALTLLALGETATDEESSHLELCLRCRADLGSFERVVAAARRAGSAEDAAAADDGWGSAAADRSGNRPFTAALQAPDPCVWAGIHRALNLDEDLRQDPLAAPGPAGSAGSRAFPASPVSAVAAIRKRRTGVWLAAAAAAIVVGAAGTWGTLRAIEQRPEVIAAVQLSALAPYPDTGSAVVDRFPDGRRELVVTASSTQTQGYREVWLLAPDAASMVSLGTMKGTEGRFALPADLDLSRYPVVDISDEPDDGNPAHSGESILRGQLQL